MITEITINNFKAFGDGAPLVLSRVNLLFEKWSCLYPQEAETIFMLISCSAFINYLNKK